MVSQKICNEDFVMLDFQVSHMLYWQFQFQNKFLINCLAEVYIYIGFWTLKVKCTQYGIFGQTALKTAKGNVFFEVEWDMPQFSVGFENLKGLPQPLSTSP